MFWDNLSTDSTDDTDNIKKIHSIYFMPECWVDLRNRTIKFWCRRLSVQINIKKSLRFILKQVQDKSKAIEC